MTEEEQKAFDKLADKVLKLNEANKKLEESNLALETKSNNLVELEKTNKKEIDRLRNKNLEYYEKLEEQTSNKYKNEENKDNEENGDNEENKTLTIDELVTSFI